MNCPSCNGEMSIFTAVTCSICDHESCLMCSKEHNCLGSEVDVEWKDDFERGTENEIR